MDAITLPASHLPSELGLVADRPAPRRMSNDGNDASLAGEGDMQAFERLYRRNLDQVRRLAIRMVGADDADDATQDVFVRVWAKAATYREESSFRTWLHRLAVNVLVRRAQRSQRIAKRFLQVDMTVHPGRADPSDARMDVQTALNRLAPEVRAVVVLHDMEGYSHEEIGQILGIGVSAARMRLHRARMALRAFASADGEPR